MRTITIMSSGCQSNGGYHRTGQPAWWAAYDLGDRRKFLVLPYTRGDRKLIAEVEIPDGVTEIYIGAGKAGAGKTSDAYRETIRFDEAIHNEQ